MLRPHPASLTDWWFESTPPSAFLAVVVVVVVMALLDLAGGAADWIRFGYRTSLTISLLNLFSLLSPHPMI